jgi:hypothetical protein
MEGRGAAIASVRGNKARILREEHVAQPARPSSLLVENSPPTSQLESSYHHHHHLTSSLSINGIIPTMEHPTPSTLSRVASEAGTAPIPFSR